MLRATWWTFRAIVRMRTDVQRHGGVVESVELAGQQRQVHLRRAALVNDVRELVDALLRVLDRHHGAQKAPAAAHESQSNEGRRYIPHARANRTRGGAAPDPSARK
eukprot:1195360-Prorocentrum_minimum.AAC.3